MYLNKAACCCAGGVIDKIWSASRCSETSCQNDPCEECEPECPSPVTFCDAYRIALGLPSVLDPAYCYLVALGGCLYNVTGFTEGSCSPVPTLTHNSVSFYGIYPKPPLPETCLGFCENIGGNHVVEFKPFEGGMNCGTRFTVSANWSGAWCNGDCSEPNRCVKEIGSVTFEWELDLWPNGAVSLPSACDDRDRNCDNCVETDPSGSNPNDYIANDQIQDNYCNETNPVDDPCDDPSIDFGPACTIYATLDVQIVTASFPPPATAALTITRSCGDCSIGFGGWISGSPDGTLTIEGCSFTADLCGTNVDAFADRINDVLGRPSDECLATYTAVANSCATIGFGQRECPNTNCDEPMSLAGTPYIWSGPFFSNAYCTATYYAQPALAYKLVLSVFGANFTFLDSDDVCKCTGSALGQWFAQYESNEILIECKGSVSASDFSFTQISGPSCFTAPSIA